MLLVLGDSFAYWAGRRRELHEHVRTAGWRGGRIADDDFRRWAIATVQRLRPTRVLLVVGGNDVASNPFSPRVLTGLFSELALGIVAAGAAQLHVLPIPPRAVCRRGPVSVSAFRRRRRLTNLLLRRLCRTRRADFPMAFCHFQPALGFVGADGVHPSEVGWASLIHTITSLAVSPSPVECAL